MQVAAVRNEIATATSPERRSVCAASLAALAGTADDAATKFARVVEATLTRLAGDPAGALRQLDTILHRDPSGPRELVLQARAYEAFERVQTLVALGFEERATEVATKVLATARDLGAEWTTTAFVTYAEAMSAKGSQARIEEFCADLLRQDPAVAADSVLRKQVLARLAVARSSTWIDAGRDLAPLAADLATLLDDTELRALRPALVKRTIVVRIAAGQHAAAAELAERELANLRHLPREVLRFTGFRARARLLGAAPELSAERDALAAALHAFLKVVREEPATASGSGWQRYSELRDAVAVLLDLECATRATPDAAERCAAHLFAIHACGSLSRMLAGPDVAVATFRSTELADDELALAWWLGTHGSFVLGLTKESVWIAKCESESRHRDRVARALAALCSPRGPEALAARESFDREAGELARWLLPAPVAAAMAEKAGIVLLGGDPAGGTPFEALPFGDTRIGLAKRVRAMPSANLAAVLRSRHRDSGSRRTSLVVASVADVLTEDERTRICIGPGDETRFLTGTEASPGSLAKALDTTCAELTVLAHGVRTTGGTARTAIALTADGDDGSLTYDKIHALHAPPLVVLGVCDALAAEARSGDDGVHHLGGAFFRAGATMVVSSSASLPFASTLELVAAFRAGLRAGLLPGEALRRARVTVAGREGDPHHFATLRLVGIDRVPFAESSRR